MTQLQQNAKLLQLWLLASEGNATSEELQQLNEWIESNAEVRLLFFNLTQQQSWLKWQGVSSPGIASSVLSNPKAPAELLSLLELTEQPGGFDGESANGPLQREGGIRSQSGMHVASMANQLAANLRATQIPLVSWRMLTIAAAILVVAYGLLDWSLPDRVAIAPVSPDGQPVPDVKAEVVFATPCLWGNSLNNPSTGSRQFQKGDALKLLEGVAELRIAMKSGEVGMQMEGPVACVLGAEGLTNLRYGKIKIDNSSPSGDSFVVETSFGRVLVSPGAEVGISAFGSRAEIHAFRGFAVLDSPWIVSDSGELTSRVIEPRQALRISQGPESMFEFTSLPAERGHFTPSISGRGNFLSVNQKYVEEVVGAKPVAYWRFEKTINEKVPNEMGDTFAGELVGDYRWVGTEDSQSIEFGVLPHPGMMRVHDSWDDTLRDDFAVEFWMKPSHYHHGTIVSFGGPFDWELRKNPLGIAVETVGGWGDGANTNRIRFVLREPMGFVMNGSTYSHDIYSPQSWQHVVAQRRGTTFETFLNGELVQSKLGEGAMPKGMKLIVGRLYTDELFRPYIGCLDEMAIYDRVLTEQEVRQHFEAMKLEPIAPAGI